MHRQLWNVCNDLLHRVENYSDASGEHAGAQSVEEGWSRVQPHCLELLLTPQVKDVLLLNV